MHEHRGEEREVNGTRRRTKTRNRDALAHVLDCTRRGDYVVSLQNLCGHGRERIREAIVTSEALQYNEDKNIERDNRVVNQWSYGAIAIVVVQRKYHGLYPLTHLIHAALGNRDTRMHNRGLVWLQ